LRQSQARHGQRQRGGASQQTQPTPAMKLHKTLSGSRRILDAPDSVISVLKVGT
jgi:hypothetical protein